MKRLFVRVSALVLAACVFQPEGLFKSVEADTVTTPSVPAGDYVLDKGHSTVTFRVSHLGFSFYTASFAGLDASLKLNPDDLAGSSLNATIDVASLYLPAPPDGFRDMLLGPDWFDAGSYAAITYQSTKMENVDDSNVRVEGLLTMKGIVRPVILNVQFNGGYAGIPGLDPNARVGFSAHGSLNRSDFELSIGLPPAGSDFGVGDKVDFVIETEFIGPAMK